MNGNKQAKKRGAGQKAGFGGQKRRGPAGTGRGQGCGGGIPGTGSGSAATQGVCVCPQCGHRESHERGVPCMQKKCAQCGAVMTRQQGSAGRSSQP